jgi:hypothetical protein
MSEDCHDSTNRSVATESKTRPWTPGPWEMVRDMDGDFTIFAGKKIIAITDLDRPDDEANARLIANAPEMAELLRKLVKSASDPHAEKYFRADAIAFAKAAEHLLTQIGGKP